MFASVKKAFACSKDNTGLKHVIAHKISVTKNK